MKDERKILTRATIYNKLMKEVKRSMIGCALMLFLGTIVFGLFILIAVTISASMESNALTVLTCIFAAAFFIYCLFCFVIKALQIPKIRREEFSVAEDILIKVEDNKFSPWQLFLSGDPFSRSNYNHIFRFESEKNFIANSGEYRHTSIDTAAQFSSSGDKFLTVFYNDKPQKIILLFSAKIYNYKA